MMMNQKGFSLIELMIYVGLLGGTALFIATLSTQSNKTTVVREADLRAAEFMQDFQLKVSRKGVCDYNFQGESSTQDPVTSILNTDGSTLFAVDDQIDSYFTITSMSLAKVNDARADLTIVITRQNSKLNSVGTITRKLELNVIHEDDGTTIKSCLFSLSEFTGDQLPLLCNGEGTILSDEGTPTDTSDDICIHAGYSIEQCPAGEAVKRFELVNIDDVDDGVVNIQPYYRPVCVTVGLPVSLSCPPNQILQGYDPDEGLVCRSLLAGDIRNYFYGDYTNCAATEQYPIQQVGSNININCGDAIDTPTPTPTPTATATGATPTGDCITVNSSSFTAMLPLSSPVNPAPLPNITGRNIKISVNGTGKGGATSFKCEVNSRVAGAYTLTMTDALGNSWPSADYYLPFSSSSFVVNYVFIERQSTITGDCTNCFRCGITDALPATFAGNANCYNSDVSSSSACALITTSPLTTLEDTVSLTICADDTDSVTTPMYDHADPFDVY